MRADRAGGARCGAGARAHPVRCGWQPCVSFNSRRLQLGSAVPGPLTKPHSLGSPPPPTPPPPPHPRPPPPTTLTNPRHTKRPIAREHALPRDSNLGRARAPKKAAGLAARHRGDKSEGGGGESPTRPKSAATRGKTWPGAATRPRGAPTIASAPRGAGVWRGLCRKQQRRRAARWCVPMAAETTDGGDATGRATGWVPQSRAPSSRYAPSCHASRALAAGVTRARRRRGAAAVTRWRP
jgi:hypothetical protein